MHLVGFIMQKFVTMHGHTNLKQRFIAHVTFDQSWKCKISASNKTK